VHSIKIFPMDKKISISSSLDYFISSCYALITLPEHSTDSLFVYDSEAPWYKKKSEPICICIQLKALIYASGLLLILIMLISRDNDELVSQAHLNQNKNKCNYLKWDRINHKFVCTAFFKLLVGLCIDMFIRMLRQYSSIDASISLGRLALCFVLTVLSTSAIMPESLLALAAGLP